MVRGRAASFLSLVREAYHIINLLTQHTPSFNPPPKFNQAKQLGENLRPAMESPSGVPWSDAVLAERRAFAPASGTCWFACVCTCVCACVCYVARVQFHVCVDVALRSTRIHTHSPTHQPYTPQPKTAAQDSSVSEATSIQLEFKSLAHALDDEVLYRLAERSMRAVDRARSDLPPGGAYVCVWM